MVKVNTEPTDYILKTYYSSSLWMIEYCFCWVFFATQIWVGDVFNESCSFITCCTLSRVCISGYFWLKFVFHLILFWATSHISIDVQISDFHHLMLRKVLFFLNLNSFHRLCDKFARHFSCSFTWFVSSYGHSRTPSSSSRRSVVLISPLLSIPMMVLRNLTSSNLVTRAG